jgi:hypothetical protein
MCLCNPTLTPGFGSPKLFVHPLCFVEYLRDLNILNILFPCGWSVNVPVTGMVPFGFTQFPNGAAMKISFKIYHPYVNAS